MGLVPLDRDTGKPIKEKDREPVRDAGTPKETDIDFLPLEKNENKVQKTGRNKKTK